MTRYPMSAAGPGKGSPSTRKLRPLNVQLEPNPLEGPKPVQEPLNLYIPTIYHPTTISLPCIHDTLKPLCGFQASIQCPRPLYREVRRAPSCIARVINNYQDV